MNTQNIPIKDDDYKAVRRLFVAPTGMWWAKLDFGQLELRILAEQSRDPQLLAAFQLGVDLHTETARIVLHDEGKRKFAKVVNFGLAYDLSSYGLQRKLREEGMTIGLPEAAEIHSGTKQRFAVVEDYRRWSHSEVLRTGSSYTMYGRERVFPGLREMLADSRGRVTPQVAAALREAFNHRIQGTAWDIFALALLATENVWDETRRLVNIVHDEFDIYVPEGDIDFLRTVAAIMERVIDLSPFEGWPVHEWSVPLDVGVSVGPNWVDQHEVGD